MKGKDAEAVELLKQGEKLMKGGLFSKPDPFRAAPMFENAGKKLRFLGEGFDDRALIAHHRAAECYSDADAHGDAARNLEWASQIAEKKGKLPQAAELLMESAAEFRQEPNARKCIASIAKAAQLGGADTKEQSAKWWNDMMDLIDTEKLIIEAADYIRQAVNYLLTFGMMKECVEIYEKEIKLYQDMMDKRATSAYRACLSVIILDLAQKSNRMAQVHHEQFEKDVLAFTSSQQNTLAIRLLDCYIRNHNEDLQKVIKDQDFDFLDNRVVRIVKALKIEGDPLPEAQVDALLAQPDHVSGDKKEDEKKVIDFT